MEKITVHGILPSMAYNNLKDARRDGERAFSSHVLTWRGLQNAITNAHKLHAEYTRTHGNGAAHRICINAVGFDGTAQFWSEMATGTKGSLTQQSVADYNKWLDQHEKEQAARYEEEDRERDAKWTQDDHGNWIER